MSKYKHIPSLLLLLFLLSSGLEAAKVPKFVTIPALFALGDSIVDQGNNNHIWTITKCNFPPYGNDFPGGIPTGRFSNGKTPADIIAEEFGIKDFLPAYLDPNLQDMDLVTGVSFASGSTGLDPLTPFLKSVLSMPDQLELLKQYIGKLKGIVGEESSKDILHNSLFLVVVGSNDIANTYFAGFRKWQYNIDSYTDLLVEKASEFLKCIIFIGIGARRIAIHGIPPIGCLPTARTFVGGLMRNCVKDFNEAAQLLNTKLTSAVNSFQSRMSETEARVFFVDLYDPWLDLIQNHDKYGFAVSDKGCCGTGTFETAMFCNILSKTCTNHSTYLFWDGSHPTERGSRVLLGKIFQNYITNLQI